MGRKKVVDESVEVDGVEDVEDVEDGEQLPLIDIEPENAKAIGRLAKKYQKTKRERMELTEREVDEKADLLKEIERANIPDQKGKYAFTVDGKKIIVMPTDARVVVKDIDEDK